MGRVVIVNGAFGIGKTSVVKALRRADPRFDVSDPERIGYVLKRLPAWVRWSTRGLNDYQDSPAWRRLTIHQVTRHARRSTGVVLLPLCVTDQHWFCTLQAATAAAGHRTDAYCLMARWETVRARLSSRGMAEDSPAGRWVYPRARAALDRHQSGGFGRLVHTDALDVATVATLLRELIAT